MYCQGLNPLVYKPFSLNNIESKCPAYPYDRELPPGTLVGVLHTTSLYGDRNDQLSFNLFGVVVLALPTGHLHPNASFYEYVLPAGEDDSEDAEGDEGEATETGESFIGLRLLR